MITETMVKPSSWVTTDVRLEKVRNLYLYKFSETRQFKSEVQRLGVFP
jgi:hypothetical protein